MSKSVMRLYVENKTSKVIVFYVGFKYPDISLEEDPLLVGIPINKTVSKYYSERDWSAVFKRAPNDTLSVFLFSNDALLKYSWDEIRSGYKVLKRLDLSQQDLEAMNYTVTYP